MPGQQFGFGPFLLDLDRHVLLREGEPVAVGYRGVLLLGALLRRPGEVFTKAELIDAGWPDATVEESNLSVQAPCCARLSGNHRTVRMDRDHSARRLSLSWSSRSC